MVPIADFSTLKAIDEMSSPDNLQPGKATSPGNPPKHSFPLYRFGVNTAAVLGSLHRKASISREKVSSGSPGYHWPEAFQVLRRRCAVHPDQSIFFISHSRNKWEFLSGGKNVLARSWFNESHRYSRKIPGPESCPSQPVPRMKSSLKSMLLATVGSHLITELYLPHHGCTLCHRMKVEHAESKKNGIWLFSPENVLLIKPDAISTLWISRSGRGVVLEALDESGLLLFRLLSDCPAWRKWS